MAKIAVVIPKYGLIGGAEQFVAELTEKLAVKTGHDFLVCANRWQTLSSAVIFHKIPIFSFPKFLTTPSFAYFTRRYLATDVYDLIHTHDRIFSADIFTLHGIPHRYWVHNVRQKKMSLYDITTALMEKKLVLDGGCRKFIAVSELTKGIFLDEYPAVQEKVSVIHPGVNLSDYTISDREAVRVKIREAYGIGPNEPLLAFASMNFEIKGLDFIINALGKLKSRKYSFRLLVAGKGNTSKYTRLAQQTGVAENIIFTGKLDKRNLIRHYLASDIYIMLSAFDTFGMVVLEAMAAGLPVIISSNVGAKDLVRENENGFVIADTSNTEIIADKIERLLDKNTHRRMSRAASATASQNTWDHVVEKYVQIYREVLQNKQKN